MARRLIWNDLDRPLKLSALSGIIGGGSAMTVMTYAMLSGNPWSFFEGSPGGVSLIIAYLLFPLLVATLSIDGLFVGYPWVLLLYPFFLVSGGLLLLGVSLERERRGILGFLVFIGSVPFLLGFFLGVLAVMTSLVGVPMFRS
jgi:hypothetical protein